MSKTIESNGNTIKISTGFSEETIGQGTYNASSNVTNVRHYQNGIKESASSKTVDIKGNSQEVTDGRGVTCSYNIKMTGTPKMFSGEAQRILDRALSKLTALLLQSGDNRHSASSTPIPLPNLSAITSKMTSSAQSTTDLILPPVNGTKDLPEVLDSITTWASKISAKDIAEKSLRAGLLEVDRQASQIELALKKKKEEFGETFSLSTPSSPATEDKENVSYNITRQDVFESYLENIDTILAAQREIS